MKYSCFQKKTSRKKRTSPPLVASIINGKYANALPLERQPKAYRCNGISLPTNTMANWVIKSSEDYISILYDRLHELLYDHKVLHADETPVKVMRIDGQIILFEWQPTRKSDHPREFLLILNHTYLTSITVF